MDTSPSRPPEFSSIRIGSPLSVFGISVEAVPERGAGTSVFSRLPDSTHCPVKRMEQRAIPPIQAGQGPSPLKWRANRLQKARTGRFHNKEPRPVFRIPAVSSHSQLPVPQPSVHVGNLYGERRFSCLSENRSDCFFQPGNPEGSGQNAFRARCRKSDQIRRPAVASVCVTGSVCSGVFRPQGFPVRVDKVQTGDDEIVGLNEVAQFVRVEFRLHFD